MLNFRLNGLYMVQKYYCLFICSVLFFSCEKKSDPESSVISVAEDTLSVVEGTLYRIKEGYFRVIEKGESEDNNPNETEKMITEGYIVIDMESLDILDLKYDPVQYDRLLRYLKSSIFFDIEKFPEAKFELSNAVPSEKDTLIGNRSDIAVIEPTHEVTGNLTIKGDRQEITFPVRFEIRNLKAWF